jgi:thiamine biosynthesis lipoprotein
MLTLSSHRELIAMGVRCHLEVVSPDAPLLLDSSVELLSELQRLWTRFHPTSDISRLNHAEGHPVHVDTRTVQLIAAMQQAHRETDGTFNPTRLPEQIHAGDSTSLATPGSTLLPINSRTFHSLDDIVFHDLNTVSLPVGMTLDAGGIGKGFAADLVTEFARSRGARAISANLGGDIRVSQDDDAQLDAAVDVQHPLVENTVISTISLHEGSVATSARNARLRPNGGISNHIMGNSTDVMSASVIASSGLWADVWAKHLILSDSGMRDIEARDLAGLVMYTDGRIVKSQTWKDFESC